MSIQSINPNRNNCLRHHHSLASNISMYRYPPSIIETFADQGKEIGWLVDNQLVLGEIINKRDNHYKIHQYNDLFKIKLICGERVSLVNINRSVANRRTKSFCLFKLQWCLRKWIEDYCQSWPTMLHLWRIGHQHYCLVVNKSVNTKLIVQMTIISNSSQGSSSRVSKFLRF